MGEGKILDRADRDCSPRKEPEEVRELVVWPRQGGVCWGEIQAEDRVSVSARALGWWWPQGADGKARRLEQSNIRGWEQKMRSAMSWGGGQIIGCLWVLARTTAPF